MTEMAELQSYSGLYFFKMKKHQAGNINEFLKSKPAREMRPAVTINYLRENFLRF